MTQGDNTRSIRRLRHDVDAIYEILEINGQRLDGLAAGQRDMIVRLDRLEGVTDGHTATLAGHTATLAEHGATLAEHGATLAEHTAVLAQHGATLAEHGAKLDQILDLLHRRLPELPPG